MEIEYRNLNIELRQENNSVVGVAITTNQPYEVRTANGNFMETISVEALNNIIESNDIFALINHNADKVLARSNMGMGSLKLSTDNGKLNYSFVLDNSPSHQELNGYLQRKDITASSFGFVVDKNSDQWEKRDGTIHRTINKFEKIIDVSPVFNAANPNTTVSKRSSEMLDELNKDLLVLDGTIEKTEEAILKEEARKLELEKYYKKIEKEYLPDLNKK